MKILKTAVVGLGRIGWLTHIPLILERADKFALTAVVDVSQERLDEAKATYGVNGYTDIASMIEAEHPDLVVVASPTHLHYEHACTAMRMGCDVFLDKPMAVDYETACAIADCAKETGRKLMVFQPVRANAETNHLMEVIASGKIGPLKTIRFTRMGYSRRSDWQTFKKFGGGMLNNYGAHHIDQLIYMTKEKVERLYCSIDTVASAGDADDVARILFRTKNGINLEIDINQAAAIPATRYEIYGQFGAITSMNTPEGEIFKIRWFDPNAVPSVTASESLAAAGRAYNHDVKLPWQEETFTIDERYGIDFYTKVYEYVAEDKPSFVPVEETLYLMELIKRCREFAEQ